LAADAGAGVSAILNAAQPGRRSRPGVQKA
jgi:hypothetical protein